MKIEGGVSERIPDRHEKISYLLIILITIYIMMYIMFIWM